MTKRSLYYRAKEVAEVILILSLAAACWATVYGFIVIQREVKHDSQVMTSAINQQSNAMSDLLKQASQSFNRLDQATQEARDEISDLRATTQASTALLRHTDRRINGDTGVLPQLTVDLRKAQVAVEDLDSTLMDTKQNLIPALGHLKLATKNFDLAMQQAPSIAVHANDAVKHVDSITAKADTTMTDVQTASSLSLAELRKALKPVSWVKKAALFTVKMGVYFLAKTF